MKGENSHERLKKPFEAIYSSIKQISPTIDEYFPD